MKRVKRHKIKQEKSESSSSHARSHEEHDLAYYIHDRVELMHQVFSILKYKELKAMAPECVRNLAIGDLEELCTEELLGISSKRLLAILDGAEPPSDTESSSPSPPPDELETISLDSISSDEELLNTNHNKKKKHKHHNRRNSKKKDKTKEPETNDNAELSKASRAGLTVLELLELQARARAIRAQLQQEQLNKNVQEPTTVDSSHHSSDNEVEIKEEPPDVVEISSEDEKPNINELENKIAESTPPAPKIIEVVNQTKKQNNSETVVKRINNLIITVPQAKSTRKIKLNRNKATCSVSQDKILETSGVEKPSNAVLQKNIAEKVPVNSKNTLDKEGKAKKKKKDKKKKTEEKDGSDHDEITLQLSDSEKMDLFENLDESRKNYDKVSSSSEDSESSSADSEGESKAKDKNEKKSIELDTSRIIEHIDKNIANTNLDIVNTSYNNVTETEVTDKIENNLGESPIKLINIDNNNMQIEEAKHPTVDQNPTSISQEDTLILQNTSKVDSHLNVDNVSQSNIDSVEQNISSEKIIADVEDSSKMCVSQSRQTRGESPSANVSSDISSVLMEDKSTEQEHNPLKNGNVSSSINIDKEKLIDVGIDDIPIIANNLSECASNKCIQESQNDKDQCQSTEKSLSDGELSDRESSEVEAMDIRPGVVCISDEGSPEKKDKKKKKKKEKKSKKSKKSEVRKSKSDFREDGDQNFYRDSKVQKVDLNEKDETISVLDENRTDLIEISGPIDLDSDEVLEIFELSDDSSCSEVEGTLLSKEPTAEEIEAFSAKIDEIQREEVVTDKQIQEHEQMIAEREKEKQCNNESDGNIISWRDRYLDSNKVKKVLTTANLFNALRKKNKELKKKIEDSKKKIQDSKKKSEDEEIDTNYSKIANKVAMEEGSIEQYNTLEGSTKYVDPVKEPTVENNEQVTEMTSTVLKEDKGVTKEMRKDAKQLLKMYRRLLKYNDLNKPTDPNKKKKKKKKKKEKQEISGNLTTDNLIKP